MTDDKRDCHGSDKCSREKGGLNLDSPAAEEWKKRELKKANDGKVGEPSPIESCIGPWLSSGSSSISPPYKQTEGLVRSLPKFVKELQVPDYSTIGRRTSKHFSRMRARDVMHGQTTINPCPTLEWIYTRHSRSTLS